jgi:hypothetical protein
LPSNANSGLAGDHKDQRDLSQTRRRNLLLLLNRHSHSLIDAGRETGAATAFAAAIGVHKSLLSKLKGEGASARDISDSMARQIEARLSLQAGWMDAPQEGAPLTSAERSFLDLCLRAYRLADARGRTELRRYLRSLSG